MFNGFRHFPFRELHKSKRKKETPCTAHCFHQKENLLEPLIKVITIPFPLNNYGEPLSIVWPQFNYPKVTFPSYNGSQIQNLPQWYHFNKNKNNATIAQPTLPLPLPLPVPVIERLTETQLIDRL
jgi:hypothetical protein